MKSMDVKLIVPESFDIEDLGQLLETIDVFTFIKKDGTEFKVKLKHSLLRDRLFVIEENKNETLD